jgi:hypothetical protein
MKIIILLPLIFLSFADCLSQNLVDFDARSIKKYMKENCKDMIYEKTLNPRFSYLKYTDNNSRQTLLFFLGTDSICKSQRMILDSTVRDERVKEFNSTYSKKGVNSWMEMRDGKNYLIEIRDETWNSVVTILPDK